MTIRDIRHPEILMKIGKMVSSGMGFASIARAIYRDYEIKTTPTYVKKVYQSYATKRSEIIAGDQELKDEIRNEVLNWKDQLGRINKITWELIDDTDLPASKLNAMKEIRQQLDLQNKILVRLEDSMTTKAMDRIQMTKEVIGVLEKLEEDGMIKILRRPGQPIDVTPKLEPDKYEMPPKVDFIPEEKRDINDHIKVEAGTGLPPGLAEAKPEDISRIDDGCSVQEEKAPIIFDDDVEEPEVKGEVE